MKCELGDICDITSSKRIFAHEYRTLGVPFFRGKEIIEKQGGKPVSTELFIEETRYAEIKAKHGVPQKGDILLTSVGTLGVPYVVQNECFYFKDGNITWFRNFRNAESQFIYYWLLSPFGRNQIDSKSIGSTQKALTIDALLGFEIDLPPLSEQRTIAATLSALDEKIANNRKINHHLEQMAQAIFRSWFVDFEPWGGEMPSDWRHTTLNELCSLISKGITPKYDDSIEQLVINQKCIRNRTIDLTLARRHNPKAINEKWLCFGDILINSTGEGTLGRAAQFLFDFDNIVVDSHVTIVRPKDDELIAYLGQWCLSRESLFASMSSGSTGQTDLPRERLKLLEMLLPERETLRDFTSVVTPLLQKRVESGKESSRLTTLRDTLLPRLMSGELSVADLSAAK